MLSRWPRRSYAYLPECTEGIITDEVTTPEQVLADRLATLADVQNDVGLALGGAQPDLAEMILEPYVTLTELNVELNTSEG